MSLGSLFPPLGETIHCPCCDRPIPALLLTNAYLCPRHGLFSIVFSLSIYYTVYSDELEAASDFPCPMTKEACPTVCKSFKMELPTVGAIDATQYIIM